jgi:putative endonuclease
MYHLYILLCADGTLYTGITTNVERRVTEHNTSPLGAKYTKGRRPVQLVYSASFNNRATATKEEIRIKKISKKEKEKLFQ